MNFHKYIRLEKHMRSIFIVWYYYFTSVEGPSNSSHHWTLLFLQIKTKFSINLLLPATKSYSARCPSSGSPVFILFLALLESINIPRPFSPSLYHQKQWKLQHSRLWSISRLFFWFVPRSEPTEFPQTVLKAHSVKCNGRTAGGVVLVCCNWTNF